MNPFQGKCDNCRFSAPTGRMNLNPEEMETQHRDIPLHRSPGKTDLSQLNSDFRHTPSNADEARPSISEGKSSRCEEHPDQLFQSHRMPSLNRHNFHQFVDDKDITLILFYHSEMPDNTEFLKTFASAACSSQRHGHTYATVNCLIDSQLCLSNHVTRTPTITLYSFGQAVGSLPHLDCVQETHLRNFVEQASIVQAPRGRFQECPPLQQF
ncbi:unnamed protein product [Candidula unifasciata]|uniref:Thioredoxin domain-containing protein n=1 Tax=Candidula unifasciata TaxID=100452 RepID=A0A8S4A4S7_9EUPU|nr:unnamed protein product [Candidula unifasciata]